ncbi:hypothetical protein Hamer_G026081, partial [Homarus americanus]
ALYTVIEALYTVIEAASLTCSITSGAIQHGVPTKFHQRFTDLVPAVNKGHSQLNGQAVFDELESEDNEASWHPLQKSSAKICNC